MRPFASFTATVLAALCALWLAACRQPETREGLREARPEMARERARPELGCTERPASNDDEARACGAHGCTWGPTLRCSGIEMPPDLWPNDVARPMPTCACVCPADVRDCMLRP